MRIGTGIGMSGIVSSPLVLMVELLLELLSSHAVHDDESDEGVTEDLLTTCPPPVRNRSSAAVIFRTTPNIAHYYS